MAQPSIYQPQSETDLRTLQDELFAKTKRALEEGQPPEHYGLLEMARAEVTIVTAIHNIKSNKGSHTTGMDKQDIDNVLEAEYPEVITRVQAMMNDYHPVPIRRVWIPKPGKDEKRPLGIPAILDRIVQECLRMILEPIMEAQFFKHSYGFRPMRDAHMALERVTDICHNTGYHWIVEGDIKGCFDNIDHARLIRILWNMGVHDRRILMIVKQMLKAGIMGESIENEVGTQQGGILSPLLVNVYLHKMDRMITREWEGKSTRCPYTRQDARIRALRNRSNLKPAYLIRYADDWVLITNSRRNAMKWKNRIQTQLSSKLKLTLSPEKTVITDVRKSPIHFLGFRYKQRSGQSRTGYITSTRPDEKRLKAKVESIRKDIRRLRKLDGQKLVHAINVVNSQMAGVGNYYRPATMVNVELNQYAQSLGVSARCALREKGVKWVPANQTDNLRGRHEEYTTCIPTIEHEGLRIGVTSIGFVRWEKAQLKNPLESPYTAEGRDAHRIRTERHRPKARDDPAMNLTVSELIAKGQTNPKYNFEYVMNRAYAFNRDQGCCRICGEYVTSESLHMHHVQPKLPLTAVNRVANLATTHVECHQMLHTSVDVSHRVKPKVWKKIMKFREKLTLT